MIIFWYNELARKFFCPQLQKYVNLCKSLRHWNASGPETTHIRRYITRPETPSRRIWPWHSTMKNSHYTYRHMHKSWPKAHLLQARDRIWFPRNEAPNNAVLQPIAFASKVNKCGNPLEQHRMRATMHTTWPRKISSLLFFPWSQHDYR